MTGRFQAGALPAVLTVEEAARVLRIGRTSAYEAARRGELPTVRIGRRLLVPRSALERLLEGGEAAHTGAANPGAGETVNPHEDR